MTEDSPPSSGDGPIPPEPPPTQKPNLVKRTWKSITDPWIRERKLVHSITELVPVEDSSDLGRKNDETDLLLKRWISVRVMRWMKWQLVTVNVFIICYAIGVDWRVPPVLITTWFSATVVQIVGIVFIIARYLFPPIAQVAQSTAQPTPGGEVSEPSSSN